MKSICVKKENDQRIKSQNFSYIFEFQKNVSPEGNFEFQYETKPKPKRNQIFLKKMIRKLAVVVLQKFARNLA